MQEVYEAQQALVTQTSVMCYIFSFVLSYEGGTHVSKGGKLAIWPNEGESATFISACTTRALEEDRGTDGRWRTKYQSMPRRKLPSSLVDIGFYKNF